jgi:hypothetical protein
MTKMCPTCGGALHPYILTYKVDPKPHRGFKCTGTCRAAIAEYVQGGDVLLVSFAESPAEPWDTFVARKWKEFYEKRRTP